MASLKRWRSSIANRADGKYQGTRPVEKGDRQRLPACHLMMMNLPVIFSVHSISSSIHQLKYSVLLTSCLIYQSRNYPVYLPHSHDYEKNDSDNSNLINFFFFIK